jgi:hypothetical protein
VLFEGDLTSRIIPGIYPEPLHVCQIEAPYQAPPKLAPEDERANIGRSDSRVMTQGDLGNYNSIGEFYTKLEESRCPASRQATTKPIFSSDQGL